MLCIPDPCFEILVFLSISTISTYVVFTYWIVLSKLIPIVNNYGSIAKMIFSSSSMMPF
jgi:hypothetical protein